VRDATRWARWTLTWRATGWLWNDYPIESPNWEVEFELEVKSKPHFGGDGLAFWLLDGKQDPTYHSDVAYLSGDVFGLKRDFKGVGVVFDVYDNDGKRDNPSIFVLYNPDGAPVTYNHDLDYKDGMYKRVAAGPNSAYSCVANIRNTPTPTKVMVKFLHKILHVYVDTDDGLGYKFCLAVAFDAPFANHHIAFTAMTGQGEWRALSRAGAKASKRAFSLCDHGRVGWTTMRDSRRAGGQRCALSCGLSLTRSLAALRSCRYDGLAHAVDQVPDRGRGGD
jgi:hypothetical protein